jgi:hypothetical protein
MAFLLLVVVAGGFYGMICFFSQSGSVTGRKISRD